MINNVKGMAVAAAISLTSMALLASCALFGKGSQHSGEASNTTGWAYNDPTYGGYEYSSGFEQETGPGLVFIEGGTFVMGRVDQDATYRNNANPRRVTVTSFYMDECEISNANYREWLYWINLVFKENKEIYRDALPDTLVWRRPLAYNEPYVENYLRHPAYADYPVVGVNWEQAQKYCQWRTDRVNENILYQKGIIELNVADQSEENNFNTEAYLYGQFDVTDGPKPVEDLANEGQTRRVRQDDGILLPNYELPTEAQWEFAALGLIGNTLDERMSDRRIYPWNSHVLRNPEDANRGQMMANFVRGNVFTQLAVDESGNIAEKDSIGRLKRQPETAEQIGDRWNYRTADAINYIDGDNNSNINDEGDEWPTGMYNTSSMYGSFTTEKGKFQEVGADLGNLISDKMRVYKGGGWRDRAYWLSPGTRRALDQRESRDDIGFRCAMVHVGNPEQGGKGQSR